MPIYEYLCPQCDVFEAIRPMSAAAESTECPLCRQTARRRMSVPNISRTGSAAFQLIDSTYRSASEPQVVSGALPATGNRKTQRYSSNPLHKKLPRP